MTRLLRPDHGSQRPGLLLALLSTLTIVLSCERERTYDISELPDGPLHVSFIGPPVGDPQWPLIFRGAECSADRYPRLTIDSVQPAGDSPGDLLAVVGPVIDAQPNAVVLFVNDPARTLDAATKLLEAGRSLITIGYELDIPGVYGHIDIHLPGGAELLAQHLPEMVAPGRSYVLIHERDRDPLAALIYQRFKVRSTEAYSLTLLEERAIRRDAQDACEAVEESRGRFRHAGLIVALHPSCWLGMPPDAVGDYRFATLMGVPALWPHLRSGNCVAFAGPIDGQVGHAAIETAIESITDSRRAPVRRVVRCEYVTSATLDDFARRYTAALGVDFDTFGRGFPAGDPTRRTLGDD